MKTLEEVMASLSPECRAKAEARGRELIQEELMLDALRRYLLTGEEGLGVEHRAALEQCPDILISTLRGHVESLGGKLEVLAFFPGEKSISLSDFE
ncbi:transcriptional regulator [Pseudomonas sp. TE50-2]|uniref:transcriptional regulator n=1 Tax=Pseudomonas sp. TE50-2 TaxID=3142707 RepID=UPI003465E2A7